MSRNPSLVTVGPDRRPFACLFCGGDLFSNREIKLNSTGAELFNLAWANQSATGLICEQCGYVHTFASVVQLWDPNRGYPPEDEGEGEGEDVYENDDR